MHITLIGKNGQVGNALLNMLPQAGHKVTSLDRNELNLANSHAIQERLSALPKTDCMINAAAYTAVDLAEKEQETAFAVNAASPKEIAAFCHQRQIPLIHYSTDYVFDGSNSRPYVETDEICPINHYGLTKLQGEQGINSVLKQHIIIRTSWVFAKHGKNFVKTILGLAEKKETLSIVADQIGCPTSAQDLARITLDILPQIVEPSFNAWGVYHYSSNPEVTWFEFANYFIARAKELRLPLMLNTLTPITTKEYPTPAKRPTYSILDTSLIERTFGLKRGDWKQEVDEIINLLL